MSLSATSDRGHAKSWTQSSTGTPSLLPGDGHRIGELIPLRRRRLFVSREEFTAMSRNAPGVDLDAFRADQDLAAEHDATPV
jgi:hypothetical protein